MKRILQFSVAFLAALFAQFTLAAVGDSVSICNVDKGGYGASTFNNASETYSFSIPASESAPTDSWVAVSSIAFGMNSSSDAAKTPKYVKINGVISQIVNGTGNQVTNVKFDNNSLKQTYSFSGLIVQVGQSYAFEFCSDAAGTKMGEMRWYMVNSSESAPMAQSSTSPGWRITQEVTGKIVDVSVREYNGTLPSAEDCTYFSSDSWAGTVWLKNISKGNGYTDNYWPLPFNYGNANSIVRCTNVTAYLGNGTYNYAIELQDDESNIALTVNAGGAGHTSVFKLKGDGTLKNTYSQNHLFKIDAQTYGFTGSFDVGGKRFEIGSGTTAQQNQIAVDADQVATIGEDSTWTATSGVVINGRVNVNGTISGTITGSGTAAYPTLSAADANKTSFQASAWHGKVEIAPIVTTDSTAVQFNLHEYGNENSTLVLKGLSGSAGRYLPGGTRIKPAVEVAGTVEFNNGGWTANYYFDGGVTGSGDLKLLNWRGNDGFDKGYHIAKLFNYTGTLTATRATTIDELALLAEPEIGQKLVKLASGSTETLRVTSVTVNGQPLSESKKIEITADGIYCRAGEVTSEETMDVFGYKNVGDIVIGNNGVQKFAGTAGIQTSALTIKNGGKLVNDPIKNPIYVTGGAPTLQSGAKIALAEKYADFTKGVFTLLTWDGDTTSTTVIPEGLFEATEAQQTNGPKLSLETYTTHVDNSKGTAKTYTALKLDLDPNGVKPKLKIMPLGDSITEGSNPDGLANPNYRVILMAKMASLGYDVSSTGMRMIKNWNAVGIYQPMEWSWHSGVSGQTLVSTGSRAGWRDSLEAMLDASEIPDIITFKIGTNDSLAGRNVDQSVAEWVEVMRRIITARPSTKIIVGSIMPFSNGGTWGDWNAKLKAAIENNTYDFPEGQVFYAPLAENCLREMDGKSNFVDSLHPNWTGHERNAETWATTITAALTAYPSAPGTYTPNEKTGAAANVGEDYIKGFTKLATFAPDGTVIAKDSEPSYSFKADGLATMKLTKVGYYMELKNTRSGNVRWVWADMDNWNEDKSFSKIAIPTAYTYCGSAQNLHVDSNDAGIEKIAPTVSGKTAWLQFTRGDLLKDTAAEGAPAAYSPRDWNDACDDNGNYGVMNLYRVAPTAVEGGVNALPAQVLMAYSRWTQDKQQIGIGNFMVHGQPLVYGNISDMPVNYYGTQDFERLNLASYELASIEIWGVPAVAKIGDTLYATLQDAIDDADDGDTVYLIADTTETVYNEYADITLHINEGVTLTGADWFTLFNYQHTLTIEGEGSIVNTINPSYSTALYNQAGTLYVQGCTIEAKKYVIYEADPSTVVVTGGRFNLTPGKWLPAKYTTSKSSDGKYFVVEALTYTAKIGEVEYDDLQSAIDAVNEGEMIELVCATDEEIAFNKDFVVAIHNNSYNYGTIKGAMGLWERWNGQYSNDAKYVVLSKSMEDLVEHVTANLAKYPGIHGRFYIYDDWTLSKNVTIPTVNDLSQSIFTVKDTFVLDLNGFTLDQAAVVNSHGGYPTIVASHGKKVTIKDSSEAQTGVLCGIGWAIDIYDNPNTLVTLESGTITTHGAQIKDSVDYHGRVVRLNGGSFIMNGGKITLDHLTAGNRIFGIITANTAVASTPHVEINGGYIECATKDQLVSTNNPNCLIGGSKGPESEVSITGGSFSLNPPAEYIAEGCVVSVDSEKNLYTVVEAVAAVVDEEGEVLFGTLKEAFAAADGKTVKLLKNQQLDVTNAADSLKVPKGVTITLDLNGYVLASVATAATSSQLILNEGSLTIMDSSDTNKDGTGSGKIVVNADPSWQYDGDPRHPGSYASNGILNKGTLTIESGYLTNATSGSAAYVVDNNSSGSTAILTINGGHLYQWFVAAVRQFANSTTYENNVTINGGIVEGYRFEWIQLPGSNTSVAPKANLTVKGGDLKSTQASGTQKVFYTYSYGNSRENSYVNISGGTWHGLLSFTEGTDTNNKAIQSAENIEITGGFFKGDIYTWAWWYGDDASQAKTFIKGGYFALNPNGSYWRYGVCPGYGIYYNTDPETKDEFPYEVRLIPVVELKVTENEVPIKVQEEVLSEIVGDDVLEGLESEDPEVRAEAEQAVSEKLHSTESNGLEVWQNYVLGLDGATEDLGVTTEDTGASTIEIVPTADPMPNSGFTVSYKMDYTDAEETTTTLDTLDIELEGEKDPTGVYQVKALLTPENGGDPIVVETKNKVGVVKAIQPMELAIVSVPWKKLSLAAHSEDIPVADLVKTTTLDEGDMLLDYNGTNYDAWRLTAGKTWESVGIVKKTENGMELVESPDPAKTTVKRGSGVFLKRKDPSKPYYLYGQVDDEAVTEALPDKVNLVANPNVTAFDLNAEGAISAAEGDTIIVPTEAAPMKCTVNPKTGKWGYYKQVVNKPGIVSQVWADEVSIPAGTGFWYEKGDKSNNSKIEWSK